MSRFEPTANRHWSFQIRWLLTAAVMMLLTGCGLGAYEEELKTTTSEYRRVASEAAIEAKKAADKAAAAKAVPGRPAAPQVPVAPPPGFRKLLEHLLQLSHLPGQRFRHQRRLPRQFLRPLRWHLLQRNLSWRLNSPDLHPGLE